MNGNEMAEYRSGPSELSGRNVRASSLAAHRLDLDGAGDCVRCPPRSTRSPKSNRDKRQIVHTIQNWIVGLSFSSVAFTLYGILTDRFG